MLLAMLAPAHAETPDEASALMKDYLDGEKLGGYVLLGAGIAGITTGTFFRTASCEVKQGMAPPLLAVGALHVAAGVYLHMASDNRIRDFGAEIDRDGQDWVLRERERMDGVVTRLTVRQVVEAGLLAGGGALVYYGYTRRRPKLQGVGLGLAIEAAFTLGFDLWIGQRARGYRDDIRGLEIVTPRFSIMF